MCFWEQTIECSLITPFATVRLLVGVKVGAVESSRNASPSTDPPGPERKSLMPEPKEDPIRKAVKQGLALVVYQDEVGVHVGVIENGAVIEQRERLSPAGPPHEDDLFFCQGWLDTQGGSIDKLESVMAFAPVWKNICEALVEED